MQSFFRTIVHRLRFQNQWVVHTVVRDARSAIVSKFPVNKSSVLMYWGPDCFYHTVRAVDISPVCIPCFTITVACPVFFFYFYFF